jgi:hypothetical protein
MLRHEFSVNKETVMLHPSARLQRFVAWICIGLPGCAGGLHVDADTEGVQRAPPPAFQEQVAERPGFVWINGHWSWDAGRWRWRDGHFEAGRPGEVWEPGRWEKHGKGWWFWAEGRWHARRS